MAANIRCIMRAKAPYGQGITKMKVKLTPTQSSTPSLMPETNTVYLSRPTEGTGELMELVGGSVAWNQLVQNGDFSDGTTGFTGGDSTLSASGGVLTMTATSTANRRVQFDISAPNGHKVLFHARFKRNSNESSQTLILLRKSGGGFDQYTRGYYESTALQDYWVVIPTTDVITQCLFYPMQTGAVGDTVEIYSISVCDLTQMLESTITDYVYSLEQATAGSGIAWLKSYGYFTEDYIAYSAPTLQSVEATAHVTVGKNLFDTTGTLAHNNYNITGFPNTLKPNTTYVYSINGTTSYGFALYLGTSGTAPNSTTTRLVGYLKSGIALSFTTPSEMSEEWLILAGISNGAGNEDIATIKPQIERGSTATAYEPYTETTYPLANITLRGIQKIDADGNLYYDGDTYEWDGTVTRKYGYVDMGSLTWVKSTAVSSAGGTVFTLGVSSIGMATRERYAPNTMLSSAFSTAPDDRWFINNMQDNEMFSNEKNLYVSASQYDTAADFKAAMSGVYLIYELATPTTESADPFTAVQTVEDGGTEEFVTTNNVPVGVKGRFANAVPMEGVDSFTVTANDGTTHTYPVTLSEEIYRGYVDMLTGEAISEAASIAEYNGETINSPWLSSLDVYSLGATPTRGAQVVYPITPEEVTATITGDPSELSGVVSATSTEGTVEWSELSEIGIKCIMKRKNPFQ